jgi:gamma-glutamylcyclotransferase (GGCT)/AIG2-like uncharacterized protein YtfP
VTTYFAYGANLDPVHMAEQCPGARRLGPAILPGHAFGIAAGGFGTVRPERDGSVHGVLWQLTLADVAALDQFEGVEANFYRKDRARVTTGAGETVEAMIYRPSDDAPGIPAPGYLERIIEVGELLGFPADYVAGLRAQRAS